MTGLLQDVNARANLAGTNKLEVLLFSLDWDQRAGAGRNELFGINVFKIREVLRKPDITRVPGMARWVEGIVSLRGSLIPVIDLSRYIGGDEGGKADIMIVTEYSGQVQGFLVGAVKTILRLDWSAMRVPPPALTSDSGGLVTAITELEDGCLMSMLDVEKVLSETIGSEGTPMISSVQPLGADHTVFFVDDSAVARSQIARTLDAMQVKYHSASNGRQAWDELSKMADKAVARGKPLKNAVQLILTDVEMPEMDGYMLTRNIKADKRFDGIPVLMHSSLSSASNQQLGNAVGVDAYVPKFEPQKLAQTLARLLMAQVTESC